MSGEYFQPELDFDAASTLCTSSPDRTQMPSPAWDTPDLPDQGNENGYCNFQREQAEKIRLISREWAIPIGQQIEFCHCGKSYQGTLKLVNYPEIPYDRKREDLLLELIETGKPDFELNQQHFELLRSEIGEWHRL